MAAKKRPRTPKPPPPSELAVPVDTVFSARDLAGLESIAATATPEEFQKASSIYFRKLLVKGLANVPVPRTIKEVQAVADMIRKSEGIDSKGGPTGGGLVTPRTITRGRVVEVPAETPAEKTEKPADDDDFEI